MKTMEEKSVQDEVLKLFKVSFQEWNCYFSNLIPRSVLSVGTNEKDAIERAKTMSNVPSDARDFEAKAIDSIMGYEVRCFSSKEYKEAVPLRVFRVYYKIWSNRYSRFLERMTSTLAADAEDAIRRVKAENLIPEGAVELQAVDS